MDFQNQNQFMYLFERIGEPLYISPRGGQNDIVFEVPMEGLSDLDRDVVTRIGTAYAGSASRQQNRITLDRNVRAPDLANIGRLCPRNTIYSYFIPNHRRAVNELTRALLAEKDRNRFLALCAVCRDDSRINCQLWLNAVASCCLTRPDMRGFKLPALYEISPGSFFNPHAMRQAREQAARPEPDRNTIMLDLAFTGRDNNEDTRLAYFREDVGINSHHWHWHLIYAANAARNRKGELFYYMHHSMMARYNAERLCNRMALITRLDITQPLREGYFPKLTDANSGMIWGTRQERTMLANVDRPADDNLRLELDDLRKWNDRISEAIDAGVVMGANGQRIPLTEERGIDILGDIVENGGDQISPNERFYGSMHNMGHVAIAYSHDPVHRHRENVGVMGETMTAMRDPIFYRWHQFVDELFDKYKQTLQPYSRQQLVWQPVQVNGIEVQSTGQNRQPNSLYTYWGQRDIDLSRGLDFTRDTIRNGPIFATLTHLNHDAFQYNITVTNNSNQPVQGVVRIFMAPRNNANGQRFDFSQQRLLFFELDKFTWNFQRGRNVINRQSTDSSVTIPWPQTFRDLEGLPQDRNQITGQQAVCGCGWPQHMLIPRGSSQGVVFDLFVMVTNAAEDIPPRTSRTTEAQRQGCKDAVSFCGILDELYPDKKPMGFPFDRNAIQAGSNRPVENLDGFIPQNSNMGTVQIRIFNEANRTVRAPGGAPANRPVINSAGEIRNPNPATSASTPLPAVTRRPTTNTQTRPTSPSRPAVTNRPSGQGTRGQPQRSPSPSPTFNTWRPGTVSPSPPVSPVGSPTGGGWGGGWNNRGWGR